MKYHLFKHLKVVLKHKHYVLINSFHLGIPLQGIVHDLSKFSFSEFIPSAKYYNGHYSPIVNERRAEGLYSNIFTHHTNHNKHHYEYWISEYCGDFIVRKIPYQYCLEFVCDMIAASKTYLGKRFKEDEPLKFFIYREEHYLMHTMSKKFIKELLTIYAQNGFKALKKKKTKQIYLKMDREFLPTELIKCFSINNKFERVPIDNKVLKEILNNEKIIK